MNKLFILPEKILENPGEITMYKTSLKDPEISFDMQLKDYIALFKLRSQPKDYGDSVVFQEKTFELEIFRASDSIWWAHNELAYREKVPENSKLPSEKEATELAAKYIEKYRIKSGYAKYSHVSYSKVIVMDKKNKKEEKYNTEINVNYSFNFDGIPIEGPGAKIQVSFVERNKLCELYYFWREPKKDIEMPVIHPENALEMFCKDDSFKQLSSNTASVKIHSIDFVYYALPPLEVQTYYLPAYKINGTAKTEFHEYNFTNYFLALDLTIEKMKKEGILTDTSSFRII